jgi:hypothetical protein
VSTYREVLNPPLSWIAFILFMNISLGFAVWAAFDFLQAFVTMAILVSSLPIIWWKLRMVVTVDDELHVDLARSFHATRPWVNTGVQVFVNDERDQTTYWLIGSKKSKELVSSLQNV